MATIALPAGAGITIRDEVDGGNDVITVVIPAPLPNAGTYTRVAASDKLAKLATDLKAAMRSGAAVAASMEVTGTTIDGMSYTQTL